MTDIELFTILDIAPKFDTATEYSFQWNADFLAKIKPEDQVSITTLLEEEATKNNFTQHIKNHDVLVFFDHGIDDALIGQNATRLVTTANASQLANKRVFAMACLSANKLGPKVIQKGGKEYWGANQSIGFTLEDANLFGEVFVDGAYGRFVEQKSIEEVLQNMKDHFDLQKTKTDNPWTKVWLEKDKNMWICWHEGNPPPEPEKTWWEKLIDWIKNLLGLN